MIRSYARGLTKCITPANTKKGPNSLRTGGNLPGGCPVYPPRAAWASAMPKRPS